MKRLSSLLAVSVLPLLFLIGCSQNHPTAPSVFTEQGKIQVALDAADAIASGQVTISKGPVTYEKPITIKDHAGTVVFNQVQAGQWNILVQLFDAGGAEIYTGDGRAVVTPNETTTVKIRVNHNTGTLVVTIELPDEDQIVFLSAGVLTRINTDGSGLQPLPNRPSGFGPNNVAGEKNLAVYEQDHTIWLVNYESGEKTVVPNVAARAPRWSPDGLKLAAHTPDGDAIVIFNRDGSDYHTITPRGIPAVNPVWLDTHRLVFGGTEAAGDHSGLFALFLINSDGSKRIRISNYYPYAYPTDAFQGRTVLATIRVNGVDQIKELDVSTLGMTELTHNPGWSDTGGVYSGEGSKIVFQSNRDDGWTPQIYIMNRDGSDQNRLSQTLTYDEGPFFLK